MSTNWGKDQSALIQYAGTTFFGIDHFEKQSGLLTLSFGASKPSEWITGGQMSVSGRWVYSGDYVDYCVMYLNGVLQGRMNVIVVPIDSNKTKVTVNARYIFTAGNQVSGIETYSFDTGMSDTHYIRNAIIGTSNSRTMMPKYKAEKAILNALDDIK